MSYDPYYYQYTLGVTQGEARSIASVLSGRFKVNIAEGEGWLYDFKTKTIKYRKEDLFSLTETDVIANLMHEVGHAKYSTNPKDLKYPGVPVDHKAKLKYALNVAEDFRIEDLMRGDYPYACDYLPLYSFKTEAELHFYQQQYQQRGKGQQSRYLQWCAVAWSRLASLPIVVWDKEVMAAADKTEAGMYRARYAGSTQEVATIISKEVYPHIKTFLDEHNEEKLEGVSYTLSTGQPHREYEDYYPLIKPLIPRTAATLRRLLTDNAFDKFVARFRTGKRLHTRKLYRHRLGDYRLFERKLASKTQDYYFALLVDESGSMNNPDNYSDYDGEEGGVNHSLRIDRAMQAAMLFSYALDRIGIPYSLHGFNTTFRDYKSAQQPLDHKRHRTTFETMFKQTETEDASYNNDGQAIHRLTELMLAHPATQRVLFVISDGEPAEIGKGRRYDLTQEVKAALKQNIMTVGFGIGDGTSAVRQYYPYHVLVNDVTQLPQAIANELKKQLTPQGGKL